MSESVIKRKTYSARKFSRATVSCPSCLRRFKQESDKCQSCGFDALRVMQQFQFTPPVLERVIDHAGILDDSLLGELDVAVDKLLNRFQQLGLYFCFVELNDPVKLPEFGFWMMNACQLQDGQEEKDRPWSLLLLVDVKRGLLALTPGYAIEAFIEDSAWEELLREISEDLVTADYRRSLLDYIKGAERLLSNAANVAKMKIKKKS